MTISFRDAFWNRASEVFPSYLEITRLRSFKKPGSGRTEVIDEALLTSAAGKHRLLIAFCETLQQQNMATVAKHLQTKLVELRQTNSELATNWLPIIATGLAKKAVLQTVLDRSLGLVDLAGSVYIHTPEIFIHVAGEQPVPAEFRHRTTKNVFSGSAIRVVRHLLNHASQSTTPAQGIRSIAKATQLSFGTAHATVTKLELLGFLHRESPRSGYRLQNPVGLLKEWLASGEAKFHHTLAFNAPSTRAEDLQLARDRLLAETGQAPLWTLASGLFPDEVFVSGLPHGAYFSGSPKLLVGALNLRDITPHNFLILVPRAEDQTEFGGIYDSPRSGLPHGKSIGLPQLAADFSALGGRGNEQSRFLVDAFAERIQEAL